MSRPSGTGTLPAHLLLLGLAGCGGWPAYAHWNGGSAGAAAVGDHAPAFPWTILAAQSATDDSPATVAAESLQPAHGTLVLGTLQGTGWDEEAFVDSGGDSGAEAPGDSAADCHARDFPPVIPGNWTGDVDWRVVRLSDAGTLCSDFRATDAALRADVLLYALDDCGVPFLPAMDGASPLGWRVDSAENAWNAPVGRTTTGVALVAAGWAPATDDPAGSNAAYSWGIALVGAGESCPELSQ